LRTLGYDARTEQTQYEGEMAELNGEEKLEDAV
jgi:hypothetical protein